VLLRSIPISVIVTLAFVGAAAADDLTFPVPEAPVDNSRVELDSGVDVTSIGGWWSYLEGTTSLTGILDDLARVRASELGGQL
jgi:hypothetical protein